MRPVSNNEDFSEDAVLGARLWLRQRKRGHRVGHDAILLAAACPAAAGDRIVDLGAGVGAAGLAVAVRAPGVEVVLVELDEQLVALARENVRANRLADRVCVAQLDATSPAKTFAAAGLKAESASRVVMNPPFNDPRRGRASPDLQRHLARSAEAGNLAAWVASAKRLLRPLGTLTLIWRADALDQAMRALETFGALAVLPVHSHRDQPAIRVLVRATKSSRAPLALLPGLFLKDTTGRPSAEAERVLRGAALLPLAELS
jgi:tRNA1(Val) A37 N6-methylase TrmN6